MNTKKIWAGIFAGALLSAALSACLLPVGNGEGLDKNNRPIPAVPPDTNLAFVFANAIGPAKCANCHSSTSHESGISFKTEQTTFNAFFMSDSVTPQLTKQLQSTFPIHRVQPGSLDSSYLWQKIDPDGHPQSSLKNGAKMPIAGNGSALTADHIKIIKAWILRGAPVK
ncbi:MAG TPA: hypothetical protein VHO02_05985 [Fibrobacteria bacterium]|jgi:hypothetical protein|nr:hypothetical protein [Fibrobacteria bacterium]